MNEPTVLHYLGYDVDRGGIVSVIRALERERLFTCILGVNAGFQQKRTPALPTLSFPTVAGETIGLREFWRTRRVAGRVASWLTEDAGRIFHGHSRAALLVAWWLVRRGQSRVVASVHCYGRQRGFYRGMARSLGPRLYWLTPAMRRYYGVSGEGWEQCIPSCVSPRAAVTRDPRPRGVTVFGGIGAIVPWKRWDLVLDAMKALPDVVRDSIQFFHLGTSDGTAASRQCAERLKRATVGAGLQARIEWRGEQPSSEAFLSEIDCLILPSHNEPFSLAMIEALQAGVPVLRADSGGAVDVIVPGVNGWHFRSEDALDLARVWKDVVLQNRLSEVRIDPSTLEPFLAPRVAAQWAAVYARHAPR